MAYGTIKVDTITFTDAGVDKSVTISGLVQNPTFSGNITVTGTVSGNTIQGQTVSGATITGGAAAFTTVTGGVATITSGVFALGSASNPSISFNGDANSGLYSPGADQVAVATNGTGRLFVDASGNVGIGATPNSYAGYSTLTINNTTGSELDFEVNGTLTSDIYTDSAGTYWTTRTAVPIVLRTNSTERLRITSGGLVGIGTSSPGTNLDIVVGSGTATQKLGSSSVAGGSYLNLHGASASKTWFIGANYNFAGVLEFTQSTANGGTTPSSTPAMVLSAAGNVGVGTSSPGSLLTSYPGNVSTLGAKASTGLLIDNNGSAGNISQIGLGYTFSGTYHPVAIAAITDSGSGSTRADLHFATRSLTTDSAPATRMIIKSDGKVGIGTTSPGLRLDIAATGDDGIRFSTTGTNNSARLELSSGNGTTSGKYAYIQVRNNDTNAQGYAFGTFGDDRWVIRDTKANSERLCVDSSGRLLVGTSSARAVDWWGTPRQQFEGLSYEQAGLLLYTNSNDNFGAVCALGKSRGTALGSNTVVQNNDELGNVVFYGSDGSNEIRGAQITAFVDGTPSANDMPSRLVFSTTSDGASSPTERLRITSAGLVGVGISAPVAKIHSLQASTGEGLRVDGADSGFSLVVEGGTTYHTKIRQGSIGSTYFSNTPPANGLIVEGSVGIGTSSPSSQLHCTGDIKFGNDITLSRNISTGLVTITDATAEPYTQGFAFRTNETDEAYRFQNGDGTSTYFTIRGSGNVGIGTTSPLSPLAVSNGSNKNIEFQPGSTCYLLAYDRTASDYLDLDITAENLIFSTNNGTERARIDSSGRLGIGTSSPSQLLTAVGNIKIAGAQAANNAKLCLTRTDRSWSIANETDLRFYTGAGDTDSPATATVVFTGGGAVGIGTAVPSNQLTVGANATSTITLDWTGDNLPKATFSANHATGEVRIGATNNSGTYFTTLYSNNSEAARIDSSGRLLVGTSTARSGGPYGTAALQVESTSFQNASISAINNENTADGVALMLGKSRGSSIGSTTIVSSGDQVGGIYFQGADGSALRGAASIFAEIDGTPGSNDMPGRLVFSTTADGASSPTERMRIDSAGNTRFNSASDSATADPGVKIASSATIPEVRTVVNTADGGITNYSYYNTNATYDGYRFYVKVDGGVANHSVNNVNLSDRNVKKDISPAADTWDCIKEWEIVNYRYKNQPNTTTLNLGVIAQQVAESCPEVITVFEEAKDDQPEKLGVKEQQMMWMAIKALQEAQTRIETLEAEVAALKAS